VKGLRHAGWAPTVDTAADDDARYSIAAKGTLRVPVVLPSPGMFTELVLRDSLSSTIPQEVPVPGRPYQSVSFGPSKLSIF
jgi:hypothetical protein